MDAPRFKIGQAVRWTSKATWKGGRVIAVVPAGDSPRVRGKLHPPKKEVSYLVAGRKLNSRMCPTGPEEIYWPRAELLKAA